jgi:transcription elongation factor Elf1
MKLNCLHCGHTVDLHNDYDNYDGMVKCFVCGALLTILTENGNVKRVLVTPRGPQASDAPLHSMSS